MLFLCSFVKWLFFAPLKRLAGKIVSERRAKCWVLLFRLQVASCWHHLNDLSFNAYDDLICRCPSLLITGQHSIFNTSTRSLHQAITKTCTDKTKVEFIEVAGVANVVEEKVCLLLLVLLWESSVRRSTTIWTRLFAQSRQLEQVRRGENYDKTYWEKTQ